MHRAFVIILLMNSSSFCADSKPSSITAAKDETIVFDEEEITYHTIKSTYFKGTPEKAAMIRPYLRRAIAQSSSDSPTENHIQEIVSLATGAALEAQQKEINKRWTKRKSAYCATAAGICSSVITAGVALAIHFTGKEC